MAWPSWRPSIWLQIKMEAKLSFQSFLSSLIHRSKKDGDMSILPECIAGIKKEYVGKDDKKQSYWIEILTQV